MVQLLASADDETSRHAEQAAMLRRALDSQSLLRATAEGRLADEQRRRMEVEAEQEELVATSQEQAAAVSAQAAELAQLRAELQRCRAEGRALAEDRARLEVGLEGCLCARSPSRGRAHCPAGQPDGGHPDVHRTVPCGCVLRRLRRAARSAASRRQRSWGWACGSNWRRARRSWRS